MTHRSLVHKWLVLAAVGVFVVTAAASESRASSTPPGSTADLSFLDGLSLVVLESKDIPSMHEAREFIESHGGHVAIMAPPSLLLGWIPDEARGELAGRGGIAAIYDEEVTPDRARVEDGPSRAMLSYFNAVVRGEIQAEYEAIGSPVDETAPAGGHHEGRPADRIVPPALDQGDYTANLKSVGLDVASLKQRGVFPVGPSLSPAGNSDYLTGTAAVTLFFIESDGSGTDPDLHTWTTEDMQSFVNSVATGLAWWSNRALSHAGCSATFLIYYYSAADPRCQQWTEPILHDTSYEYYWVNAIMENFGYTVGNRWSRVTAFNTWQRSTYQTARAFSAFIPYNPVGEAPAAFPDGHTAYAYFYGPYIVQLFNLTGNSNAQIFAHETGHIFGACDEYADGCSHCGVCTNGVDNGNCETCNPRSIDCIMKYNDWNLCAFTPGQVGWGIESPCTPPGPPPLPAPAVAASYPSQLYQGLDGTVTITGTDFYAGAWVDFGPDVFVHTTTLAGAETLVVDVTVFNSAPPGLYDVTVINRDFQEASLTGALEVLPTTHHYFSPTGSDQFPYITPTGAATSLEEAISAGDDGDTLFVPSMTLDVNELQIETGVLLHGAWDASFTSRDLAGGKTVIPLTGNVSIFPGADGAGLDGFILEGGEGSAVIMPFIGHAGGGIRILDSHATIANCELRFNEASGGTSTGAGGGIYAEGATVDIRDNFIHDNTATWGGGIYLYDCSGSVTGNIISNNTTFLTAATPQGGGVLVTACDGVVFAGNTIEGNSGAENGGGVQVEYSTNVTIEGGTIAGNSATLYGGGVNSTRSDIDLKHIVFDHNSGVIGGGVGASDTSTVGVSGCSFQWNSGAIGGGVATAAGVADIHHNLFVGNNSSASGAAVYVSDATAGRVAGNTVDRNSSASGAGILFVVSSDVEVFDNIVANSTGHGISVSGPPFAWTGYNLVWNSSGSDYDGTGPGEGALSGDPVFADTTSNDYHLGAHSPAIDAGRLGAAYQDPDQSRGDMGWYGSHDFPMDQPSYPKNLIALLESGDVVLRWDKNPEPDVSQYVVYCDSVSGFKPTVFSFLTSVSAADSTVNVGAAGDSLYYVVGAVDTDGYASGYSDQGFAGPATGAGEVAYRNRLHQNVPNPFNPMTKISYELSASSTVRLTVYDVRGRAVKRLADGPRARGAHTAAWDGTNDAGERVSSGIYFYRLDAGAFVQTRKMLLLK